MKATILACTISMWLPLALCAQQAPSVTTESTAPGVVTPNPSDQLPMEVKAMLLNMAQEISRNHSDKLQDIRGVIETNGDNLLNLAVAGQQPSLTTAQTIQLESSFIKFAATAKTDKQVGSVASSAASTSLVQKPGIAQLLGVAVENGAVLDDVNETTLTLSTTPYKIITSFAGRDDATLYQQASELNRFGVSASFQIAKAEKPLDNAGRKQLSNWGATIRLTPDRSARSAYTSKLFNDTLFVWQQDATNAGTALSKAIQDAHPDVREARAEFEMMAAQKVHDAIKDLPAVDQSSSEKREEAALTAITEVYKEKLAPTISNAKIVEQTLVARYISSRASYLTARTAFVKAAKDEDGRNVASLVYNYQQPTDGTAYSEFGGSYVGSPRGFGLNVTANILGSAYSKPSLEAHQHTFRAVTVAVDLKAKLSSRPFLTDPDDISPITISFSGRYQRLQENQHVAGKRADIGEGNIKLEIPLPNGISLPISATFANAGQTISEGYVRGNFGLSFDLDKLSTLLKR